MTAIVVQLLVDFCFRFMVVLRAWIAWAFRWHDQNRVLYGNKAVLELTKQILANRNLTSVRRLMPSVVSVPGSEAGRVR